MLDAECPSLAVHAFIDGKDALDARLGQIATDLGWLLLALPEAQGGLGLGAAGLAILHYELGRAVAPGALLATSVALEVLARSSAADEPAVADLIAGASTGTATLAVAAKIRQRTAGAPIWLLGEPAAAAALVVGEGDDLILLDLQDATLAQVRMWDETRAMVTLADGQGSPIATLTGAKPLLESVLAIALAADSAGAARGTLDRTIAYMKEREQFGRPIGSFQALKHRVADHHVNAIGAGELVWQAAEQFDAGAPGSRLWSLLAKANASEAAAKIAGDCVQLHGGVGFTREYDPHLFLKRIRLNEMLIAPNGVLRDAAERAFADALRDGHDVLEIA